METKVKCPVSYLSTLPKGIFDNFDDLQYLDSFLHCYIHNISADAFFGLLRFFLSNL